MRGDQHLIEIELAVGVVRITLLTAEGIPVGSRSFMPPFNPTNRHVDYCVTITEGEFVHEDSPESESYARSATASTVAPA